MRRRRLPVVMTALGERKVEALHNVVDDNRLVAWVVWPEKEMQAHTKTAKQHETEDAWKRDWTSQWWWTHTT